MLLVFFSPDEFNFDLISFVLLNVGISLMKEFVKLPNDVDNQVLKLVFRRRVTVGSGT